MASPQRTNLTRIFCRRFAAGSGLWIPLAVMRLQDWGRTWQTAVTKSKFEVEWSLQKMVKKKRPIAVLHNHPLSYFLSKRVATPVAGKLKRYPQHRQPSGFNLYIRQLHPALTRNTHFLLSFLSCLLMLINIRKLSPSCPTGMTTTTYQTIP